MKNPSWGLPIGIASRKAIQRTAASDRQRTASFSYFIPTMIGLASSELPEAAVKATLSQWLLFNHGRHILTLSGWLMALKALSLPSEHRG